MSTQKAKFALFNRLQAMGFTYEEAVSLRRIEMTLSRWAEAECNGEIERNEKTGRPERVSRAYVSGTSNKRTAWPMADREAGALKRLSAIMARHPNYLAYHQTDPRGCALYIVAKADLPEVTDEQIIRHSGEHAVKSPQARQHWLLSCYYTRGLAVCA